MLALLLQYGNKFISKYLLVYTVVTYCRNTDKGVYRDVSGTVVPMLFRCCAIRRSIGITLG